MTDEEWRKVLGPQTYNCARHHDTECAGTGDLLYNKEKGENHTVLVCNVMCKNAKLSPLLGMYKCKCCYTDLFPSKCKFVSGTGWPSFSDAVPGSIEQVRDTTLGMVRTEARCK